MIGKLFEWLGPPQIRPKRKKEDKYDQTKFACFTCQANTKTEKCGKCPKCGKRSCNRGRYDRDGNFKLVTRHLTHLTYRSRK